MGGKARKSQASSARTSPKQKAKPAARAARKAVRKSSKKSAERRYTSAAPELFEPLTEGERADAQRILVEDKRLASMAKVGRYRVLAAEPLVVKPPHRLTGRRLARLVAFDYASDRSIEAGVDLDEGIVAHLQVSKSQPLLAPEEEAAAVAIALADERVKGELGLGDLPQAAMHYWSRRAADLAYARRSAAVLFGQDGARPSLVAVVDLLDNQVTELVPADQW